MRSYAGSDPGRRENNEDVVWADDRAGLYIVVDGMGGHSAGEHAAQIACDVLRRRLSGTLSVDRMKESIAEANNEIHKAAVQEPEKSGMGCVLTVARVEGENLLIGHVGDTRLYRIQGGGIVKLTRDHSPVGDLEADGLITEEEAQHHPRRNFIYRDVGTTYRRADTPEFIDVYQESFPPDAALILCSDGLTETVAAAEIMAAVGRHAGHPERSVKELITLANERGGRDNISLIVVENDKFNGMADDADITRRPAARPAPASASPPRRRSGRRTLYGLLAFFALVAALLALDYWRRRPRPPLDLVVKAGSYRTIADALRQARPGDTVKVTPGVYRETVQLRSGIHLLGEGAVTLMPERFPAVIADRITSVILRGFEIGGGENQKSDGAAILINDSDVLISQCQVGGNTRIGIELRGAAKSAIVGSTVAGHEIGILILGEASPRLQANRIMKNAIGILAAERSRPDIFENQIMENHKREVIIEETSWPARFEENVVGTAGVEMRHLDPDRLAPTLRNDEY